MTALSLTVFTADAALPRTVALFTRGCFLEGAGAARPAFPCCFGNRASAPANGRAGIMTSCVRINQTAVAIWQRVDTRQILISSPVEENMAGNKSGIKQTHVVKPIKNQQFNPPMRGYEVTACVLRVCFTCTCRHVSFCYCYGDS